MRTRVNIKNRSLRVFCCSSVPTRLVVGALVLVEEEGVGVCEEEDGLTKGRAVVVLDET